MNLGRAMGRLQFHRARGGVYVDAVRPWILPVLGGAGIGHYLGIQTRWAVLGAALMPIVV